MPFDPDDSRLTAFALGELDPADRVAIEAILRDDSDSRAFVLGIEETARLLTEELRHEATPGLDASRRGTIEERLATPILAMPAAPAPRRSRLGIRLLGLAVAASILGVAVGLMLPAIQSAREEAGRPVLVAHAQTSASPPLPSQLSDLTRPLPPRQAYKGSGYPGIVATPSASPTAASKPASPMASAPGAVAASDMVGADAPPSGKFMKDNVSYFTAGAKFATRDAELAARTAALAMNAPEASIKHKEGDPSRTFKAAEAANGRGLVSGTSQPQGAPAAAPAAVGDGGLGMSNMGMMSGMSGMTGGMGGGGARMMMGDQRGSNQRSDIALRRAPDRSLSLNVPPQRRRMSQAEQSGTQTPNSNQRLPQLAAGLSTTPKDAPPGQPIDKLAEPPAVAYKVNLEQHYAETQKRELNHEAERLQSEAKAPAPSDPKPASLGVPFIQGSAGKLITLNGAQSPVAPGHGPVTAPPSGPQSGSANVTHPPQAPASDQKAMLGKDAKLANPESLTVLDSNALSDNNQIRFSREAAPNQVAAAEPPPPAEEGKPSEPQTQLALNNHVDFNQQRIDAIQREVANKQAELQQLQEQVDATRRRMFEEKAKVDREAYARLYDNPFTNVEPGNQLSTFAVDVDTAAYANVRRFLSQGQLPPVDAVRIEEMINYFAYDDPAPKGKDPFSVNVEVAACPWDGSHRLARIGLKGKSIDKEKRPMSNLVFLIDVSGSMADLNKLPFLKAGMKLLVEQLTENDRVGIVTYSNDVRVALPSTPCHRKDQILDVLDGLKAEGGTNGGAGVQKAYEEAQANFIKGGTNRVILATDGDFNVGLTKDQLLATSEERAKGGIFLSVLGFGQGNIQEEFMEQLADKGNGNYSYIDNIDEARKVLVRQMSGTLVVIAKDVKVQVEFNPDKVAAFRLIGYENRVMANDEFRNDNKDAGEMGAGHSVTALYEIVPNGAPTKVASAGRELKYKRSIRSNTDIAIADKAKAGADAAEGSPETLTVSLRYKQPDGNVATEISQGVIDDGRDFSRGSGNLKFASAVAGFGMMLRESPYKGSITLPAVVEIATSALGEDRSGDRKEFVELVKQAERIVGIGPPQ